jgi:Possible lysine decarboxylase
MACTRQHGMSDQPIVCVNVHGFYEPFQIMLKQAYQEGLIEIPPQDIVHFEDTPEGAIRWVEDERAGLHRHHHQHQQLAATTTRKQFMSAFSKVSTISVLSLSSLLENIPSILHLGMALATGVIIGVAFGQPKI